MKYMLDTNICVYIMKHIPEVTAALEKNRGFGASISSITLAELEYGVYNSAKYEANRETLIKFLPLVKVLPFSEAAAAAYGSFYASLKRKGAIIGQFDALIAGHALSEGLTLVTNNTREFARVSGLKIVDWTN